MIQIIKEDLACKITPKYKTAKQFEKAFFQDSFVPSGDIVYLICDNTTDIINEFDNVYYQCCSENDTLYITTIDTELNLMDKELYRGCFVEKTFRHINIDIMESVMSHSMFLTLQSSFYKVLSISYLIDHDKQSISYVSYIAGNYVMFGRWDKDLYGLLPLDGQHLSDLRDTEYGQLHYLTTCTQQMFQLQFSQPLIIKHASPQLAVRVRYIPIIQ